MKENAFSVCALYLVAVTLPSPSALFYKFLEFIFGWRAPACSPVGGCCIVIGFQFCQIVVTIVLGIFWGKFTLLSKIFIGFSNIVVLF